MEYWSVEDCMPLNRCRLHPFLGGRIIDNLQIDNLQIDNLQIDNLQIDNLQITFIS